MKITDFGPRMQRFIRFINRLESRLEKQARARGRQGTSVGQIQYPEAPADDPTMLDWGMGKASLNPVVRQYWNDHLGG